MAEMLEENVQVPGRVREELCLPCTRKDKMTVATVFCYDCDNFQCKQCADVHKVFDIMKDHKMAKASEITTKPVKFDMKGLTQCETHGKLFEFLCKDHDMFCCSTCAIINHRACDSVVEIHNVAGVSEETSMEIRSRLVGAKELCDSAVMHWNSSEISLRDSVKNLPEKINNIRAQMNKRFDDLLQDVEKDSATFMKLQLDKGKEKISKCDGLAKRFQTSLKFLDEVSLHGTIVQKFIAEHEIQQQVKLAQKEVEHECDQLETADISFKLNEILTIKEILEGKDRLGTLKTETNKVTVDEVRGHRPVHLEFINSIDLKLSEDDESESMLYSVDFLPDERIVGIVIKDRTLLIFNEFLDEMARYKLSYQPLGVVAVSEDTIAITGGNKTIEFLHVSKSNEITNMKTYKVCGKFNSVCLKDVDNFVVGAFDDIKLARILSLSGEVKDFGVTFHSKLYRHDAVSCTYINELDKVIISDRDENLVYIYDVTTNTRVIVRDSRIQGPRGVAVGPMNCVFVCCKNTDSIVQVSPTGVILSSHKLEVKFPFHVCVSEDKTKLAVSNRCKGKSRLQVLKIN
ncbi:transcription intermediary factor 1-alpha-like [Mercenaria mercenaria]|uniref:transcription intermediary factor 1-alpha-like n=1 Tax=Mercenaria mercenaria TaxID=6596 RepID=UPI00234EC7B7|nr:transcription intermediary factor 1-alpha-like [Mercenaria mercenaria]